MKLVPTALSRFGVGKLQKNKAATWPLIYPVREWAICLLVTFIVGLCLFGYTALYFYNQLHERETIELAEGNLPRYQATDAKTIINYFDGKERTFNALRKHKQVPVVNREEETKDTSIADVILGE